MRNALGKRCVRSVVFPFCLGPRRKTALEPVIGFGTPEIRNVLCIMENRSDMFRFSCKLIGIRTIFSGPWPGRVGVHSQKRKWLRTIRSSASSGLLSTLARPISLPVQTRSDQLLMGSDVPVPVAVMVPARLPLPGQFRGPACGSQDASHDIADDCPGIHGFPPIGSMLQDTTVRVWGKGDGVP